MADPTDITLTNDLIDENSANGSVIGVLGAADADVGDTFTFAFKDVAGTLQDAGGAFAIVFNVGTGNYELVVANSALLDFEGLPTMNVTIIVTDFLGGTFEETLTITLNDVNETPTDITLSNDTVDEQAANGTVVGALGAVDQDSGETFTYAFLDNAGTLEDAGGRFAISGSNLVVLDGSLLDADTTPTHDVTIIVTDSLGNTFEEVITITLNNIAGETWTGTAGDDTHVGTGDNDTLSGLGGNDTISGGNGKDTLVGGTGNDYLDGGLGADSMNGGVENETYVVDNVGDIVNDTGGVDLIIRSFNSASQLGLGLENLTLKTGSAAAITALGNATDNVITGNEFGNTLDGKVGADTMIGGLGNDSYVVEVAGDVVQEAAGAGTGTDTVTASINYTLGDNVETLVIQATAGTLSATGNGGDNLIVGNSVSNLIDGALGADTMQGGAGEDTYIVDDLGDVVEELSGGGTDLVRTTLTTYTLGDNLERLELTSGLDSTGIGNAVDNTLTGGAGDDWLDGMGAADVMLGNGGDDVYIVDHVSDSVTENVGEGAADEVRSSVTWTLGANFESLTLTGSNNINGFGNDEDNSITGNSGNNSLSGGAGADTYVGGDGNDTYVVDSDDLAAAFGDLGVVIGFDSAGIDTIQTSVTTSLFGLDDLENITLTGTGDIDATGSDVANILIGNSGANVLDGKGAADQMTGNDGSDTYVVDNAGDVVTEGAGGGGDVDVVHSSVNFTLGNNVENLTLLNVIGALNGTGNSGGNAITGNDNANMLDGMAGVDTMAGGDGDDTYIVDNAGDSASELAAEGTDEVQSAVSFTLGANIENLTLTGVVTINGTGNADANIVTGNGLGNLLDGGAGADSMLGGLGNDTYILDGVDADVVTENADEGTDRVKIGVNYTLGDNVEELELTGALDADGTGNGLGNKLIGNTGANTLDGGIGIDTMAGGAEDDTYIVDVAGEVVTELLDEGLDTVRSSVAFTLGANVENLELTGIANINGVGNGLANTLTGNDFANTLNGGLLADTMIGGGGDDIYVVNESGDIVTELAGGGNDTVQSAVSLSLTTIANVENLTLTGTAVSATGSNGVANKLTGNTVANTLNGGTGADTMTGGGGNDTYTVDNVGDVVIEFLSLTSGDADRVNSNVNYTLSTYVEILQLMGTATNGTGNTLKNTIYGNINNNILDGMADADTMTGGNGDDTYIVNALGDVVIEANGLIGGDDTVLSGALGNYTLAAAIENLTLTGASSISGTGNFQDNVITGNSAANAINGFIGADTMNGGDGNDTYTVDNLLDVVGEVAGEGTADTVKFSIAWTTALYDNVENLVLNGSVVAGTGNGLANKLTGNASANLLDGGALNDTMVGGLGDDTYIVDIASDVVTEGSAVGAGTDEVRSSVSYALSANIENLVLISGAGNINATGNAGLNTLTGNEGENRLNGGALADTLIGGNGNDTYVVDNAGDVVTELADEGVDLVESSVSYSIVGLEVEKLTLTGTGIINGTGNTFDNVLTGNGSANLLTGGGGADSMIGGAGNDTFVVDSLTDILTESLTGGTDTVQSSITWVLAANFEHLTLTGGSAINGTGNVVANTMTGNGAANALSGFGGNDMVDGGAGNDTLNGGLGNDTLIGGADSDIFVFNAALGAANIDALSDFSVADDTIRLDELIFTGLTVGALAATAFIQGAAATTAAHRIVVNGADVYYDADGNGAGAAVKFATLDALTAPTVTFADFVVI